VSTTLSTAGDCRFEPVEAMSVSRTAVRTAPQGVAGGFGHDFRYDVAIVGLGYVGLPTALAYHAAGQRVLGVDLSEPRIAAVRADRVDLLDTDHSRLGDALADPRSFALSCLTIDGPRTLASAATIIVCVPTPVDRHLTPDLGPLAGACATVVSAAVPGQLIVLTSTSYVGCTRDLLVEPLARRGLIAGRDLHVAFSPERIDPANSRHAHETIPRVVGGVTVNCTERAATALSGYADHVHSVSSAEAAEMTKLVENTFRAVNIALANEFADVSAVFGLDVSEVIDAAATKPYGFMPFYPGPGVGGHCIPCDPHYLLWQLRAQRAEAPVTASAMAAVAGRPTRVIRAGEMLAERGMSLRGADVLVLGVAYKPGVGDVRESSALTVLDGLVAAGTRVAYSDSLVPTVCLQSHTGAGTAASDERAGAQTLASVADPDAQLWDLVIVHTVHPDTDLGWLDRQAAVLDTTYRLAGVAHRTAL
jgi:UDP-N-acetyl-D-glucosamine dehydrogenase